MPDKTSLNGRDRMNIVCAPVSGETVDPGLVPYNTFLTEKQRANNRRDAILAAENMAKRKEDAKEEAEWERKKELAAISGRELAAAIREDKPAPSESDELVKLKARLAKAEAALESKAPRKRGRPPKAKKEEAPVEAVEA